MSAGKETTDEIGAAFWAEPNVTGVVAAPILGPYGRNQLSIAVNATHQHGDPSQSPRNPQRLSASNHVKTKDNLRPPLMCGLNQWIGGARRLSCSSAKTRRGGLRRISSKQPELFYVVVSVSSSNCACDYMNSGRANHAALLHGTSN